MNVQEGGKVPMKTYRGLFEQMLDPEVVAQSTKDASVGKLNRKEVLDALLNFDKTYIKYMACLSDRNFRPNETNNHFIVDGVNHKVREIEKPNFNPEQIFHHAMIHPFKPVLMEGLYEGVYGCLPATYVKGPKGVFKKKFGVHHAVKRLLKWVRTSQDGELYICEADIHHAYGSVNLIILCEMLQRVIKDTKWLAIVYKFLFNNRPDCKGLVLGHYTSPWFFNFYLKRFDHFVAALPGVKYLRFADNLYLIGKDKKQVHEALAEIKRYLFEKLDLTLNDNAQVYRFEYGTGEFDKNGKEKTRGRAINALGMVIHHNRVTLRKSLLMRMRRKAFRLSRKIKLTWHDASSMFARISWIKHTDTHNYYLKWIRPYIDVKVLKSIVSSHSRAQAPAILERRRMIDESLENSEWLSGRKTFGI